MTLKMNKRGLVFIIVILALGTGVGVFVHEHIPLSAAAQASLQKKIILDGKEYTKEQLIEDFLNIAFSKKDWPISNDPGSTNAIEDYKLGRTANGAICCTPASKEKLLMNQGIQVDDFSPTENFLIHLGLGWLFPRWRFDFEALQPFSKSPVFSEYFYRPHGIPDREGVYKWTRQKVKIGFYWPRQNLSNMPNPWWHGDITRENCDDNLFLSADNRLLRAGECQEIADHVNTLIPELEKITGLDLHLQMPWEDAENTLEDYARIRIIPVFLNPQKNFFKIFRYGTPSKQEMLTHDIVAREVNLVGAVSYTTDVRSQVDGYLLPEADNSLGMSVCKIMHVVGRDMMKALITECLLRALGLPDISKSNDRALLGNWNKEYDSFSKLEDLDGREQGRVWEGTGSDAHISYFHLAKEEEFPKINKDLRSYMSFSDYDKMMAKLLYCPAVKAGMKKEQVRDVLAKTDMCFLER